MHLIIIKALKYTMDYTCKWQYGSGGSRGELGGVISAPNSEVSPPNSPPPQINDGPYIKRQNAYDIAK